MVSWEYSVDRSSLKEEQAAHLSCSFVCEGAIQEPSSYRKMDLSLVIQGILPLHRKPDKRGGSKGEVECHTYQQHSRGHGLTDKNSIESADATEELILKKIMENGFSLCS